MTRTNLFVLDKTQAVHLPDEVAFPASVSEVVIQRQGARRVIVPAGGQWDDFFDSPGISIDEPDDLPPQDRDSL